MEVSNTDPNWRIFFYLRYLRYLRSFLSIASNSTPSIPEPLSNFIMMMLMILMMIPSHWSDQTKLSTKRSFFDWNLVRDFFWKLSLILFLNFIFTSSCKGADQNIRQISVFHRNLGLLWVCWSVFGHISRSGSSSWNRTGRHGWRVCLLHSSGKQFKGTHHFVENVPGRHTQGTPVQLLGDWS